jgi:hypothetical protein
MDYDSKQSAWVKDVKSKSVYSWYEIITYLSVCDNFDGASHL